METNLAQLVSTYGLLGQYSNDTGAFKLLAPFWDEDFPTYGEFARAYELHPVCVTHDLTTFAVVGMTPSGLIRTDVPVLANLQQAGQHVSGSFLLQRHSILLRLDGVRHHLFNLALAYIHMARLFKGSLDTGQFKASGRDPGTLRMFGSLPARWLDRHPEGNVERLTSEHRESGHEFNAFLWAARSLLDSYHLVLNLIPSVKESGVTLPISFHDLTTGLEGGKYALPGSLESPIRQAWDHWAERLKHYRDCMDHFTLLAPRGWPYSDCLHCEDSVVGVHLALPDNPEAKRASDFGRP